MGVAFRGGGSEVILVIYWRAGSEINNPWSRGSHIFLGI